MRCGCPHCEAFMVHRDLSGMSCVCPDCGYRCTACLGTGTVISKETIMQMKDIEWFSPQFNRPLNDEEAEEENENISPFSSLFKQK